jgi:hypothetical protein
LGTYGAVLEVVSLRGVVAASAAAAWYSYAYSPAVNYYQRYPTRKSAACGRATRSDMERSNTVVTYRSVAIGHDTIDTRWSPKPIVTTVLPSVEWKLWTSLYYREKTSYRRMVNRQCRKPESAGVGIVVIIKLQP